MLISIDFSYKFAIQCFFGYAGCDYVPGLRGSVFIAMYVISYLGSGLLIRYDEGATYLAVVQVSTIPTTAYSCTHVQEFNTLLIFLWKVLIQ